MSATKRYSIRVIVSLETMASFMRTGLQFRRPDLEDEGVFMATSLPSAHPVAAVDVQRLRHDIVAVGARQKHGRAGNVFRHAHPAEWNGFADQALFLANRTMLIFREQGVDLVPHRSVDDPRSDCVDIDAVLDQFEGEALRQAEDRRLGRAIDGDAGL